MLKNGIVRSLTTWHILKNLIFHSCCRFLLFFCQHSTCSHAKYHSCLTNCWNDMAAQSHNEKASALGVEWNFYSYAEKFVVTSSICLHTRHIMNIREKCFPSRKRFVIILTWRLIVLRVFRIKFNISFHQKKILVLDDHLSSSIVRDIRVSAWQWSRIVPYSFLVYFCIQLTEWEKCENIMFRWGPLTLLRDKRSCEK